jgi:hypothetical protein
MEAQFQHVKSHQNRQKRTENLSFPAKLNVRADELAQNQRTRMKEPATMVTTDFHHLTIGKQYITRDSQRWLLDAASRIPIRQYYQDKYGWSTTTFNEIDWDMQHKVLMRYGTNDQRRILKLVHEWLPTNSRLARERSTNTQRCKLCHYIKEDAMHLFRCRHAKQTETRHALLAQLNKTLQILEPEKSTILNAIERGLQDTHWKPEYESRGMKAQNLIGWQQIYRGRFAKGLIKGFRLTNETSVNGQAAKHRLSQKILKLIWDTFLQLWKQRNELIFGEKSAPNQEAKRDAWIAKVERCYELEPTLAWKDRSKLFTKSKEEVLAEDHRKVAAWVKLAERLLKINKKEARMPDTQREMIEQYFKWHPPDKRHGRRNREKEQHHKQNLKPD